MLVFFSFAKNNLMKSEKKCVLIYSIVLYHLKFKVKSNLDTYSFFNYKIYFRDNNMTKL